MLCQYTSTTIAAKEMPRGPTISHIFEYLATAGNGTILNVKERQGIRIQQVASTEPTLDCTKSKLGQTEKWER